MRVGNAAHAQLQLDVYGELMDAFHQARMTELKLDEGTWASRMHSARASREGLGSSGQRHLGAARRRQALCLFKGDDVGGVRPWHQERREVRLRGAARPLEGLRDTIHRDVCEKGFDASSKSFVKSYGSELLDASILLLPAVAFAGNGCAGSRHACRNRTPHDAGRLCAAARSSRGVRRGPADRRRVSRLHAVARGRLRPHGRDRQGANAVRSRGGVANDLGLLAEEFDPGAAARPAISRRR